MNQTTRIAESTRKEAVLHMAVELGAIAVRNLDDREEPGEEKNKTTRDA